MNSSSPNELFHRLTTNLDDYHPVDWEDISNLLNQIRNKKKPALISLGENPLKLFANGVGFITFGYGIDGVSIEISKYAHILNNLFAQFGNSSIHMIGGKFYPQAKSVLSPEWNRFEMDGIDGWDKWENGKWFDALFRAEMKSYSEGSNLLTNEIYKQAVSIAKRFGEYFVENHISLLVPVNVASNPGNLALTLGLVLVTELLGIYVLNSNHDFYWEAGRPPAMRKAEEEPGVRDHFFRNLENKTFFSLFESLYPWNGNRWLQANINARQTRKLINEFGRQKDTVFEISTCISNSFFEPYSREDILGIRQRMGYILSDGHEIMHPVPIDEHLSNLKRWMKNQRPVILASRSGFSVAPVSKDLLILLQPTRVVSRKRIERDLELIGALFQNSPLRKEFENNPNSQLILHITGPTPIEHQADLETVLLAYKNTINILPESLAERIFLAFSAGYENHESFSKKGFAPLTIETIYRMADAVVFPSETEGRGLPIIEASASGIPIICSQYHPKEVFGDVIGEGFSDDLQIRYSLFPEGEFSQTFLSEVAELLINTEAKQNIVAHNRAAVQARYSTETLSKKIEQLLNLLYELDQGA